MVTGGEHPHLNCIQKCGRPQIEGPIFEKNETKPYNARLILENSVNSSFAVSILPISIVRPCLFILFSCRLFHNFHQPTFILLIY